MNEFLIDLVSLSLGGAIVIVLLVITAHWSRSRYAARWRCLTWLKSLCLLVRSIHWFNPAVWYMAHLIERDTELGCDEEALRHLPPEEHAAYGETILHAVERLKTVS